MERGVEKLILDNTDLVYSTIHKMHIRLSDDIASEGLLALVEAANNFDESIGTQFSTYAVSYIKGRIKTYLTIKRPVVKPARIRGKYVEIETIRSDSEVNEIQADNQNIESSLIVKNFLDRLTVRERIVATGLLQDKTQKQIGEELKVCQTQVSQIIRVIRYKYMSYNLELNNY